MNQNNSLRKDAFILRDSACRLSGGNRVKRIIIFFLSKRVGIAHLMNLLDSTAILIWRRPDARKARPESMAGH